MKVSKIRELLEKYAQISADSGKRKKALAIIGLSKTLAPADNKSVATLLKKLSERKKQHRPT